MEDRNGFIDEKISDLQTFETFGKQIARHVMDSIREKNFTDEQLSQGVEFESPKIHVTRLRGSNKARLCVEFNSFGICVKW
jgi:hypothetical protein